MGSVNIVGQQVFRDRFQEPTIVRLEGCITAQMTRATANPPTASYQIAYFMGIMVAPDALSAI